MLLKSLHFINLTLIVSKVFQVPACFAEQRRAKSMIHVHLWPELVVLMRGENSSNSKSQRLLSQGYLIGRPFSMWWVSLSAWPHISEHFLMEGGNPFICFSGELSLSQLLLSNFSSKFWVNVPFAVKTFLLPRQSKSLLSLLYHCYFIQNLCTDVSYSIKVEMLKSPWDTVRIKYGNILESSWHGLWLLSFWLYLTSIAVVILFTYSSNISKLCPPWGQVLYFIHRYIPRT